jgi:hypothetical protein
LAGTRLDDNLGFGRFTCQAMCAKCYRPPHAICATAVDDEILRSNPCATANGMRLAASCTSITCASTT